MQDTRQPVERKPEEIVLFALAFASLGVAGGGILLRVPGLALAGAGVALIVLLAFFGCSSVDE